MSDFKRIVESDFLDFLNNSHKATWTHTRAVDFTHDGFTDELFSRTRDYERNIVFLGCSLTYGEGVEKEDTYPAKVQELSNNKWNCINLGICGSSIDMAYLLFNKVKDFDIDDIVIQWPNFHRRAYFEDGTYHPYIPMHTESPAAEFSKLSDIEYCIMRNLPNLQVINSFKSVYNLSPNIGHERKDLFKKYGIDNILDFHWYYDMDKKYILENDNHPNELWYKEYAEYLFRQIL